MKNSEFITFKSKRNDVFLHDGLVEKHFSCSESAAVECEVLSCLRSVGVRVPKVCANSGAVLKMQYIPGVPLPDLIETLENCWTVADAKMLALKLIAWFRDFYGAVKTDETGEIRGDVNGRNFIFDEVHCWGVDFEERVYGTKEQDIGRLIAFVLTYDPPETTLKNALADIILRDAVLELGVCGQEVCRQRDLELDAMRRRRAERKN